MRDLGADFADDRLRETLVKNIGVGADSGQPTGVRFLRSVQSLVRKRIDVHADGDLPAVFLLNESLEVPDGARRMGMIDYGDKPIEGQIWYAGPALGFARALDHECGHDDVALFEMVRLHLGEGATPAVVFLPRISRTTVRYYPDGLASEDDFEVLSVEARQVSLEDIFATLDRLHINQLVTPIAQSAGNKLWQDADRFYPVSNAELVAQSYVETALWARFSHCRVEVEKSQVSGRFDVALLEYGISGDSVFTRCYAVLELKVLRSFGKNGTRVSDTFNQDWVRKGLDQAFAYAEELKAESKALCCFDMRTTDTGAECFSHVITDAARLDVALRRWHLYGRLSDYRNAVSSRALQS